MTVATSLIPGLDEIVKSDDPKRRTEAARQISELFLQGAAKFRPDHVDFFDGFLIDLVPHSELGLRAELAERFSQLANAPSGLVGRLVPEKGVVDAVRASIRPPEPSSGEFPSLPRWGSAVGI